MTPRLLPLLTAALLATAALTATAQNLSIGFADPVSSADPQLNNHAGDRSLALQIWDSIIDRRDGQVLPSLAESWKTLDDKTWEFKLRKNVKWQDGQPFTADDIVFTYELVSTPALDTAGLKFEGATVDGDAVTLNFGESKYVNQARVLHLSLIHI